MAMLMVSCHGTPSTGRLLISPHKGRNCRSQNSHSAWHSEGLGINSTCVKFQPPCASNTTTVITGQSPLLKIRPRTPSSDVMLSYLLCTEGLVKYALIMGILNLPVPDGLGLIIEEVQCSSRVITCQPTQTMLDHLRSKKSWSNTRLPYSFLEPIFGGKKLFPSLAAIWISWWCPQPMCQRRRKNFENSCFFPL